MSIDETREHKNGGWHHRKGAKEEREAIVAYLRKGAAWESRIFRSQIWENAAQNIEEGSHLEY